MANHKAMVVEGSSSELWSEVAEQLAVDPSATFDDYVQCDEATWTSAELTTDDILQSVQGTETHYEECSHDMDNYVTVAPEDRDELVSATDALEYLRKLRLFIGKSGTATEAVHKNADGLELFVLHLSKNDHGLFKINVPCLTIRCALL
ncbi:hypothetical protein HPB49_007760 [Dermacentor silvarum]|uniref:Uncharacterized protein n=1 Tax=Dermacentor silvarum TaxID=543639 RepID=A0ACB8DIU3_DERSI|nr:hypothetical protein HPB49_007760 [Dermacentor silvarum]